MRLLQQSISNFSLTFFVILLLYILFLYTLHFKIHYYHIYFRQLSFRVNKKYSLYLPSFLLFLFFQVSVWYHIIIPNIFLTSFVAEVY